jgi:hypothetical protein
MNLNRNQLLAIAIAVLSVLAGSTSQLTDLFGPAWTKIIIAISTISTASLSSVLAVITSQGGQVHDVLGMTGVEHIDVNASANKTLATIAMDPDQKKISPTDAARPQVIVTASQE